MPALLLWVAPCLPTTAVCCLKLHAMLQDVPLCQFAFTLLSNHLHTKEQLPEAAVQIDRVAYGPLL